MRALLPVLSVSTMLGACGPSLSAPDQSDDTVDAPIAIDARELGDGSFGCPAPATPAGPDVQLAPEFVGLYAAYDLGPVPGVPNPLGGAVVQVDDHDTLLIAGGSESAGGAIYSIGVVRNACGHITGWEGVAQLVATTPYVDANLVYADPGLLLYSEWPQFTLSQLTAGTSAPARRTDLRTIGMLADGDSGPGGAGVVPPGLAAEGQLRLVTWPAGRWYHVDTAPDGTGLLDVTTVAQSATIGNEPGGFAYVPAGSPGFTLQSIIVAEWRFDTSLDRVAIYDADDNGDPVPTSRREFFTRFPRPWGAYFEPVTGDYLFLSWGTGEDHVYIVQGFVPPPVID